MIVKSDDWWLYKYDETESEGVLWYLDFLGENTTDIVIKVEHHGEVRIPSVGYLYEVMFSCDIKLMVIEEMKYYRRHLFITVNDNDIKRNSNISPEVVERLALILNK